MQPLPSHQLNPKIKAVWRINDAIWIIICYLICMVPCAIVAAAEPGDGWPLLLMIIFTVLFAVLLRTLIRARAPFCAPLVCLPLRCPMLLAPMRSLAWIVLRQKRFGIRRLSSPVWQGKMSNGRATSTRSS